MDAMCGDDPRRPTLLVVDDAEVADATTRGVARLGRRAERPAARLATARPGHDLVGERHGARPARCRRPSASWSAAVPTAGATATCTGAAPETRCSPSPSPPRPATACPPPWRRRWRRSSRRSALPRHRWCRPPPCSAPTSTSTCSPASRRPGRRDHRAAGGGGGSRPAGRAGRRVPLPARRRCVRRCRRHRGARPTGTAPSPTPARALDQRPARATRSAVAVHARLGGDDAIAARAFAEAAAVSLGRADLAGAEAQLRASLRAADAASAQRVARPRADDRPALRRGRLRGGARRGDGGRAVGLGGRRLGGVLPAPLRPRPAVRRRGRGARRARGVPCTPSALALGGRIRHGTGDLRRGRGAPDGRDARAAGGAQHGRGVARPGARPRGPPARGAGAGRPGADRPRTRRPSLRRSPRPVHPRDGPRPARPHRRRPAVRATTSSGPSSAPARSAPASRRSP